MYLDNEDKICSLPIPGLLTLGVSRFKIFYSDSTNTEGYNTEG